MDSEQPDSKMSNSDPDCLLPEDDKIKFEISKTPMLEDHAKKEEGPSSKECETSPSSPMTEALGNKQVSNDVVVDEQNDGFKTPTALDHKIPVITECPPHRESPEYPCGNEKRLIRQALPAKESRLTFQKKNSRLCFRRLTIFAARSRKPTQMAPSDPSTFTTFPFFWQN